LREITEELVEHASKALRIRYSRHFSPMAVKDLRRLAFSGVLAGEGAVVEGELVMDEEKYGLGGGCRGGWLGSGHISRVSREEASDGKNEKGSCGESAASIECARRGGVDGRLSANSVYPDLSRGVAVNSGEGDAEDTS
jgi:hypothetical protein